MEFHGFSVVATGKVTPTFRRALRRLNERGYCDPLCTVAKTAPSRHSGITHMGGRYIHPNNPIAPEVMDLMRHQGIETPSPPFVVAPGEATLYHEWGHHVDRCWSCPELHLAQSFFLLSHFYDIEALAPHNSFLAAYLPSGDARLRRDPDPVQAALNWRELSSELFADLFEDWMRGDKKIDLDCCDPDLLNSRTALPVRSSRLAFLPGIGSDDIRADVYTLFAAGLQHEWPRPELREDFFGSDTDDIMQGLHFAAQQVGSAQRAIRDDPGQSREQ